MKVTLWYHYCIIILLFYDHYRMDMVILCYSYGITRILLWSYYGILV